MSWMKRIKEWAAEEVLSSADLNAEFDNIIEALNGLIQADSVISSSVVSGSATSKEAPVPGTTASITLERPSLVIVTSVFNIELVTGSSSGKTYMQGYFVVDSGKQPHFAEIGCGPNARTQGSVAETYVLALGEGAHTFQQKFQGFNVGAASWNVWSSTYSYIIVPNPSP